MLNSFTPELLAQSAILLFLLAVLGQSGLDKAMNYVGNLAYFREVFKNSPLAPAVSLLLPVVTLTELAVAALSLWGLFGLWTSGDKSTGTLAAALACLNFVNLIFGMRMAKDYGAAAGITPYFCAALIGLGAFAMGG